MYLRKKFCQVGILSSRYSVKQVFCQVGIFRYSNCKFGNYEIILSSRYSVKQVLSSRFSVKQVFCQLDSVKQVLSSRFSVKQVSVNQVLSSRFLSSGEKLRSALQPSKSPSSPTPQGFYSSRGRVLGARGARPLAISTSQARAGGPFVCQPWRGEDPAENCVNL